MDEMRPKLAVQAMDEMRLKLAVQKSGRLTEPSLELLAHCGLKLSRGKDQLMGFGENMPLDVLFVRDRKSTRLNSSHEWISYAVFCLKKKKHNKRWKVYIY